MRIFIGVLRHVDDALSRCCVHFNIVSAFKAINSFISHRCQHQITNHLNVASSVQHDAAFYLSFSPFVYSYEPANI